MLDKRVAECLDLVAAAARTLRIELAVLTDTIVEQSDPAGVDVLES